MQKTFTNTQNRHKKVFQDIYHRLYTIGKKVSPRGFLVIEAENFKYVLPPYVRFSNFSDRLLNLKYIKQEFLWYLRGNRFDLEITNHAKLWKSLVCKDGGINSNYGQYIFGKEKQYDRVVQELKKDRDSRRASILILTSSHYEKGAKDIPCTYSLNFRIRNNALNMTVHMRSQDAILGMGNDAPAFSFIHEMMTNSLREFYPSLAYGEYFHIVDSFHVYEKHFEMLKKILKKDCEYTCIKCPKISGYKEVEYLKKNKFQHIPENFKFTAWLNS